VVTFQASGVCVIDANQGGQGNILAATQVQQSITVVPAAHRNAPSAPINVAGTSSAGGVEVSWSPPMSSGTSAITGYVVTISPGGASCTSATTSCQLSGLVAGTSYTMSVIAINATGDSPAASATFSFHVTAPATPSDVTVSPTGTTVSVSWHAPPGVAQSADAGYRVTLEPGGQQCTTITATRCVFADVPLAGEYTAQVTVLAASGAALGSATGRASVRDVTLAHFAFSSFALTANDRGTLGRFATMIIQTRLHAVTLIGFTDDLGRIPYNQVLSQERAGAVARYLTAQLERRGYRGLVIRETGKGMLRAGDSRAANRKVTAVF
jgi:outer membrane protein OmpA-like peptidoglycan-associated protein